eukprot:96856-Amphidinium_carterae.1
MACEREAVHGSSYGALGVAPISKICSLLFYDSGLPDREKEDIWQSHVSGQCKCVAEVLVADGGIVWAVPSNPQLSHCLACEDLLHLALWLQRAPPGCEGA